MVVVDMVCSVTTAWDRPNHSVAAGICRLLSISISVPTRFFNRSTRYPHHIDPSLYHTSVLLLPLPTSTRAISSNDNAIQI